MCIFCHDPKHAESKYGGDSYLEPVRKRGVHTRFLEDGGVHTRFPDDDSCSASESSFDSLFVHTQFPDDDSSFASASSTESFGAERFCV